MNLNHLNLTVKDVTETYEFLQTYFGLGGMSANNNIAMLSDDNGMVLTLTSMKVGGGSEVRYPATFHIGFIQESEARVNEINRQLKEAGFEVPPPSKQHGSWTFYFRAPGGFTIEVLA
jgi:catechol-2,3-dioxygenase